MHACQELNENALIIHGRLEYRPTSCRANAIYKYTCRPPSGCRAFNYYYERRLLNPVECRAFNERIRARCLIWYTSLTLTLFLWFSLIKCVITLKIKVIFGERTWTMFGLLTQLFVLEGLIRRFTDDCVCSASFCFNPSKSIAFFQHANASVMQ
jgi:hypothetical protein